MTVTIPNVPGTNTGHVHVWPRPDGRTYRCGGLRMCQQCRDDHCATMADDKHRRYCMLCAETDAGRLREPQQ